MIKFVLDTNVFISGIFWSGAPAKILNSWQENKIKMICSLDILEEYERVGKIIGKKFPHIDLSALINLVTFHADIIKPIRFDRQITADPDDDKFIATALAAKCPLIISGDKHLLDVNGYADLEIIKPGAFVQNYL